MKRLEHQLWRHLARSKVERSVLLKLDFGKLLDERNIDALRIDYPSGYVYPEHEFDGRVIAKRNHALVDLIDFIVEIYRTSAWLFGFSPICPWPVDVVQP